MILLFTLYQKSRYAQILLGVRFHTKFGGEKLQVQKHLAYWWQLCIYYPAKWTGYAILFGLSAIFMYGLTLLAFAI